uniref:SH2 domain-containing protein n=1 Tax=Trichobilharzia regenti TaxID=157069 RepID=A0AA85JLB2_TRIRE|nr:unnamed protein product [Trichobilharzia regenti]
MPEATTEDICVVQNLPSLEHYYHGYIDRAEAEKRLQTFNIPNSYLLRLSRTTHGNDTWENIYVLSYLSSARVCFHFRLIPRFHCFQLGGRFFDSLDGCLSRYYTRDIMTGERLKHPIPPTSLPIEYHTQRLRAIQDFEPDNAYDRLGCAVDDRFLLVHEDPNSDWLLATSLKSRHSGYLPKSCVEKEYPEIIERLDFFHPDSTSHPKELLKKAGAFSYLLRPCDSRPGLYTLLLYDGIRVRKCRLELVVQSELIYRDNVTPTTNKNNQNTNSDRRNSGPSDVHIEDTGEESSAIDNSGGDKSDVHRRRSDETFSGSRRLDNQDSSTNDTSTLSVNFQFPLYRTTTKILYSGTTFPSVEAVVAAIESHHSELFHTEESSTLNVPVTGDCLMDTESANHSTNGTVSGNHHVQSNEFHSTDGSNMHTNLPVFKPVNRERKPQIHPPSSTIYMDMFYARQPPAAHQTLTEIHGELSVWSQQRKKWKSYYAQLDRKQSILTLVDGEKRKPERFDLSKCDFFPIHYTVYDKEFCFGLILYGASAGDREDFVLCVEAPCSGNNNSSNFNSNYINPSTTVSSRLNFFSGYDLDATSYAGRPEEPPHIHPCLLRSGCCRHSCEWAARSNLMSVNSNNNNNNNNNPSSSRSPSLSTSILTTSATISQDTSCHANCNLPPATLETVYQRWITSLKRHCRNTKADSATEDNVSLRQTHLRCYRSLEIKFNNARLTSCSSSSSSKSRRDESVYSVNLDGLEIARAYSGSSVVSVFLDEFPFGFKKVEVLMKEDKRKRSVAVDLDLVQYNVGARQQGSNSNCSATTDHDRRLSVIHSSSSSLSSSSAVLHYSICDKQERSNGQITVIHRELHVIPFQYYEGFRQTILNCLHSELVPLCIHVWKALTLGVRKANFVSSLLLTTIELNCHLELIVNLLRIDVNNDKPNTSFRSSSLGAQILDMYSNTVCSAWRSQCFRRVCEKALEGPPPGPLPTSSHSTSSSNPSLNCSGQVHCNNNTCNGNNNSKSTSSYQHRSGIGSAYQSTNSVNSHQSLTTRPCSLSTGADTTVTFDQASSPTSNLSTLQHHTRVQEWHYYLLSIVVDDLISHVRTFPLQMRWIYSELQALYPPNHSHVVVCNLVFLRGLCPVLSSWGKTGRSDSVTGSTHGLLSGFWTSGVSSELHSSVTSPFCSSWSSYPQLNSSVNSPTVPSHASDALVIVAKTLLALVNLPPKIQADGLLSSEQFMNLRTRLIKEFRLPITSPLSPNEIRQLEQLHETEARKASCKSLSRELAQLANYFLEAFNPKHSTHHSNNNNNNNNCPTHNPTDHQLSNSSSSSFTSNNSTSTGVSSYEHKATDYYPISSASHLYASLIDLAEKTHQFVQSN